MVAFINLVGSRFGRLQVLRLGDRTSDNRIRWFCICDCGNSIQTTGDKLRNGNSTSCGCKRTESVKQSSTLHGLRDTPEYEVWQAMKARCIVSNHKDYPNYGGRGIAVCDRWMNSMENFYADMGPRPTPKHSIERNDVNGDYSPNNCRWGTAKEQGRNKTNTRWVEYNGQSMALSEVAEITSLDYDKLKYRLNLGYSIDSAIAELKNPNRPKYARRDKNG